MTLQFDKDRKLFLESFPGIKTFQTFQDNKKIKPKINLIRQVSVTEDSYPCDNVDFTKPIIKTDIIMGLEKLNDHGACVSLTINETDGKGRKRENMQRVRAVWSDFDEPNTILPKFDLKPSMVINTSPGKFHCYWLTVIDDEAYQVPLQGFATIQESIAKKYDTDESMKDITKAMRIPGFWHKKKEPYLVNIVEYTGKRYSFGDLVEYFPPVPVKAWSADKWKKEYEFDNDSEFKGQYGCSEGNRNHTLCKIIGGMLHNNRNWGYIENEVWKHNEASSPPLPESEVRAVIKSMRRY